MFLDRLRGERPRRAIRSRPGNVRLDRQFRWLERARRGREIDPGESITSSRNSETVFQAISGELAIHIRPPGGPSFGAWLIGIRERASSTRATGMSC